MGSYTKELKLLAKKYQFTLTHANNSHWKLTRPGCPYVIAAATPKSDFVLVRIEADLKRAVKHISDSS